MLEEPEEVMVTPRKNVSKLVRSMGAAFMAPDIKKMKKSFYSALMKDFKLIFRNHHEYNEELDGYITSKENLDLCMNAFLNHYNDMTYFNMSLEGKYDLYITESGEFVFKSVEKE